MNEMSLCGFCGHSLRKSLTSCPYCGSIHRDASGRTPFTTRNTTVQKRILSLEGRVRDLEVELEKLVTVVS